MSEYTVRRTVKGEVTIYKGGDTHQEPATTAHIYRDGRYVTSASLNACLLCLPGGSVRGMDATDEQIIRAVLGDEDIFTGAPAYPEYHDEVNGDSE